jgi:hypothetical protein
VGKILQKHVFLVVASVLVVGLGVVNLAGYERDGVLTSDIESYDPSKILLDKLWRESPPQVLSTFFTKGANFYGAEETMWSDRLRTIFGDASVIEQNPNIDIRNQLDPEQLDEFLEVFDTLAYSDTFPCPDNAALTCEVGVAWDRARTKEPGINIIFARVTDSKYLFFDDTIIVPRGS